MPWQIEVGDRVRHVSITYALGTVTKESPKGRYHVKWDSGAKSTNSAKQLVLVDLFGDDMDEN